MLANYLRMYMPKSVSKGGDNDAMELLLLVKRLSSKAKIIGKSIKSNHSLYSLYYVEACSELVEPTSASLCQGNIAPFEEMSQRWRAVGNCPI